MLHQADFTIPVEIEGQLHNVYVIKRPGVDHFMKRVGELYEVVVFTASVSKVCQAPRPKTLSYHHSTGIPFSTNWTYTKRSIIDCSEKAVIIIKEITSRYA